MTIIGLPPGFDSAAFIADCLTCVGWVLPIVVSFAGFIVITKIMRKV